MKKQLYPQFLIDEGGDLIELMEQIPVYSGKRRWWEKYDMPYDPKRPLWKRIFNVF
ncbi:MAG: hypothetical protein LBT80_07505 [Lactobacillaceae bacterium]|jgi:hypothetical protein|nr:hypothetical protein [Lactobacillaceae bacterium]